MHAFGAAPKSGRTAPTMAPACGHNHRVRILLVDFINQEVREGVPFDRAVVRSAAVRAKPIVLTGLAALAAE